MDIIQRLLKLVAINTKISALHSSDEIMAEIMNEAMSLTGTSAAFILRVPANRELECLARYRSDGFELEANWSSSSALEAHDSQRMVYSTRALESSPAPSIVMGSIQTLISAPLSSDPGGTTILQLMGRDTTSIDPQTISLLNLFVSQVQVTTAKTKLEEAAIRSAALAATGELAAQVAHDIRSPLAALEAAEADLSRFPEEQRAQIRGAVGRIRGIADSLLDRQRAGAASVSGDAPISCHRLSGLIESLILEKRLQYRSRPRVELEVRLDTASSGIFANVQPVEFQRLLSNLVNNAVESFEGEAGSVRVTLSADGGAALVSVKDDGKGIAAEVLAKLGRRGETHGKDGGSGLGLHHARFSVEAWGGSLEIVSAPSKGTTVTIRLPRAPSPERLRWDAILIDDDALARATWKIAAARLGKQLRSFPTVAEFLAESSDFDRATPLYIDADLGDGVKGDIESSKIHSMGFVEIYLATGHAPEKFSDLAHLRGVVGKEPPWSAAG